MESVGVCPPAPVLLCETLNTSKKKKKKRKLVLLRSPFLSPKELPGQLALQVYSISRAFLLASSTQPALLFYPTRPTPHY